MSMYLNLILLEEEKIIFRLKSLYSVKIAVIQPYLDIQFNWKQNKLQLAKKN